jgi:hypothetical protein
VKGVHRILAWGVLGVFLCGAPACTVYRAPELTVAAAELTERTADGTAMQFVLNAENPNTESLPLREVRYSVVVDGRRVFSGVRDAQATLRRLGTQQIRLPAAVPASTPLPGGSAEYRVVGSLTYVTPGRFADVLFDAGLLRPNVGFQEQGSIDLSGPAPGSGEPPP